MIYTKARHRTDLQEYLVHFIDLQKSFCDVIKAKQNVGLESALELIDEEFKGKQHDALCDAYNTAAILHKLCCSENLYVEFEFLNAKNKEKKEEKKEVEYTSSLGSLLSPELQKLFGCSQTSEEDEETANSDAIDQTVPQGEEEEMTDEEIKALGNKTLICSRYGIPKLSLYNFCNQIKDTDCMKVDL